MKKVSLAATVALALMGATTVANANGTVKSQPAATPAPAPATTAAAAAPAMTPMGGGALNPASVELIARPGNHKNTNFELDVMFPVFQPSCGDRLLAIDIRGMRDVNRNTEGNGGLVYRHIVNNSFVLGGYGYFDYRRTRNKNNFTQVTLGVDVLSNMFDARFNGYIAQNKKKAISGGATTQFITNNIARFNQFEIAQSGFDGEVGVRIPMPGMNNVETRVFVGGYRFSRGGTKTMSGPRGRLEVRILDLVNPGSRLTLGLDVSNDKVRKTTVNGVIGLRIPMQFISGGRVPQGLQRRLADYVYRDINVNVGAKTERGPDMVDPDTKKPYKVIHIKGSGSSAAATTQSGKGTAEDPYTMWDAASVAAAAADPGTITLFTGSGTITAPVAGSVTPTNFQSWFGAGTDIVLTDANDGASLKVQSASSSFVKITGNVTQLFDLGLAASTTVRGIGGFEHNAVGAAAGLIAGTFTAGTPKVFIRDIKATVDNAMVEYIGLTVNGNFSSEINVSNMSVDGIAAAGARGVAVTSQGGAKLTLNTSKLNITGGAGAGANGVIGVLADTVTTPGNASSLTLNDKGSSYKGLGIGIKVHDNSGTVANQGSVKFDIASAKIDGMTDRSILISRQNGGAQMSNVSIDGTIRSTTFTGIATANQSDVYVDSGTGASPGNVVLKLQDNTHDNTTIASQAVGVEMQQTAGNASTVNISMSNVSAKGVLNGSAITILADGGNYAAGTIRINMAKVTTSGYTDGIALFGAALGANPGQIQLDMSSGDNKIDALTNSFFGNTLSTAGAVTVAAVSNTFIPLLNGANGGTTHANLTAQLPKLVSIP